MQRARWIAFFGDSPCHIAVTTTASTLIYITATWAQRQWRPAHRRRRRLPLFPTLRLRLSTSHIMDNVLRLNLTSSHAWRWRSKVIFFNVDGFYCIFLGVLLLGRKASVKSFGTDTKAAIYGGGQGWRFFWPTTTGSCALRRYAILICENAISLRRPPSQIYVARSFLLTHLTLTPLPHVLSLTRDCFGDESCSFTLPFLQPPKKISEGLPSPQQF